MGNDDSFDDYKFTERQRQAETLSYEHHPVEDIEPIFEDENIYKKFHRLINQLVCHILEHDNPKQGAYVVGLCTDAFVLQNKSMEDIAQELNITRQAISKEAKSLSRQCSLSPARMRPERITHRHRRARVASIKYFTELEKQKENTLKNNEGQ